MSSPKKAPKWKHFSAFSTAAEEVSNMKGKQDPENEGGSHVDWSATRGRVVQTPGESQPYKVVLEHRDRPDTDHAVDSMREGEAFIRAETPTPPKRNRGRDAPR
jgi:hypothetical protein